MEEPKAAKEEPSPVKDAPAPAPAPAPAAAPVAAQEPAAAAAAEPASSEPSKLALEVPVPLQGLPDIQSSGNGSGGGAMAAAVPPSAPISSPTAAPAPAAAVPAAAAASPKTQSEKAAAMAARFSGISSSPASSPASAAGGHHKSKSMLPGTISTTIASGSGVAAGETPQEDSPRPARPVRQSTGNLGRQHVWGMLYALCDLHFLRVLYVPYFHISLPLPPPRPPSAAARMGGLDLSKVGLPGMGVPGMGGLPPHLAKKLAPVGAGSFSPVSEGDDESAASGSASSTPGGRNGGAPAEQVCVV